MNPIKFLDDISGLKEFRDRYVKEEKEKIKALPKKSEESQKVKGSKEVTEDETKKLGGKTEEDSTKKKVTGSKEEKDETEKKFKGDKQDSDVSKTKVEGGEEGPGIVEKITDLS